MQLHGVGKTVQGDLHLDDIELELEPGRLYVLLGPTTAGKTSLMRVLAGLDRPSEGQIIVDGQDVTGVSIRKRDVAMVYQQFINYPAFTVFDNIAAPLRMRKMSESDIGLQVRKIAGALHIQHLLDRLPAQLSGGQQQRCAIARALVRDSALLLLDEPLVNLDYKLREELREELQTLFESRSSIVVYSTTEPHEALVMGGEVIVMDRGRVLQTGPTARVYHRPGSAAVARVFSDPPMNMIEVLAENGIARTDEGIEVPLPPHLHSPQRQRILIGVRACHLALAAPTANSIAIAGRVELAEISGSETFIHVAHGRNSWVIQQPGVREFEIGSEVNMFLDPASIYVFGETGALEAAPREAEDP